MASARKEIKIKIDDDFLKSRGAEIFNGAKSGRELFEERLTKDLDLYHGRFSKDERKWSEYLGAQRLFINKTYTSVQRIVVDIIDAFYPDQDELVEISSWKDTPWETRQIVKSLINYRLNCNPIKFYQEMYEAGVDAVRNMVAIFKVYPKIKTEKVPVMVEVELETGETVTLEHPDETEEVITAWSPRFECTPPEDVFFSKWSTWKTYHKNPVCHRYEMSVGELIAMGFKNIVASPAVTDPQAGDYVKENRERELQYAGTPELSNTVVAAERRMVYEFWDFLPDDDGEIRGGSYFMVGDKSGPQLIARGWEWNELPYQFDEFEPVRHPFIVGEAFPEPHMLYGKSFPWITENNQKEINAIANQEREAVARALRPPMYVNRDGNVDLVALMNRRIGATVQGDGPADGTLRELATLNPMSISPMHRSRVDMDYAEAGIPPNLMGTDSGSDTATESTQQLSNANKKIALVLKNLAYTLVLPSFSYLLRLIQTYETDEFIEKVTGRVLGWGWADDGVPRREYIQGDFDLRVNLGIGKQAQLSRLFLMMDRGVSANQATAQMLQMGLANPQTVSFIDLSKPYEEAMKIIGFKDIENWRIQAQQAPVPADAPGLASQPRPNDDPMAAISQTVPGAPSEAFSVL